jgi:hypothetical protein
MTTETALQAFLSCYVRPHVDEAKAERAEVALRLLVELAETRGRLKDMGINLDTMPAPPPEGCGP